VKFTILPADEMDAADAAVWYDDQRIGLGEEFLDELKVVLDRVRQAPEQAARLEHYSGLRNVRRYLLKRFPYVVVFVCQPHEVVVVAVSHARRRPLYWLKRLA
jgi:toxin ParE1/3/4